VEGAAGNLLRLLPYDGHYDLLALLKTDHTNHSQHAAATVMQEAGPKVFADGVGARVLLGMIPKLVCSRDLVNTLLQLSNIARWYTPARDDTLSF